MGRDFMGLAVNQEALDDVIDAAPLRTFAAHCSLSRKASAHPLMVSFLPQEKAKTGFDSLACTGMVATASPRPLAGVPTANPFPAVPSNSPSVGTTDLRNASAKMTGSPAQLTIFYNGSVCVYDNICPEKAIMLLAENRPPVSSSTTISVTPVQASISTSSVYDHVFVNQPYASPIPLASTSLPRSSSHSAASKSGAVLLSSNNEECLPPLNSSCYAAATLPTTLGGSVPLSRSKSLARFLKKRKQRMINASPLADKQSPDSSSPQANNMSSSINSSGSSTFHN